MGLVRSAGTGLVLRAVALALTVLIHLWLARELGPTGYGGFVLALIIQGTVALAANIGLGSALGAYVARAPAHARAAAWAGAIVVSAVGCGVAAASWLLLSAVRPVLFGGLADVWVVLGLLTVPLRLVQEVLLSICIGLGLVRRAYVQGIALPALFVVALVGAVKIDEAVVAAAWFVANIAAVALAALLVFPATHSPGPPQRVNAFGLVVGLLGTGAIQTINYGAWWLLARISRIVLGAVAGADAVGRFSIGAAIADVIAQIPTVMQATAYNRIARGQTTHGADVALMTRLSVAAVAVIALFAAVVAGPILEVVLGPGYSGSAATFVALVPGVIALTPVMIIGVYFLARLDQPALNLIPTGVGLLIIVPAVWWLSGSLSVVGAGLGTSVAYIAAGATAVVLFAHHSGAPWRTVILPTRSDLRLMFGLIDRALRGRQ